MLLCRDIPYHCVCFRRGFGTNDGSKKRLKIEIQQQLDIYVNHILDMVAMQWICIFSVTNDGNNMVISQLVPMITMVMAVRIYVTIVILCDNCLYVLSYF
eukprot:730873_1